MADKSAHKAKVRSRIIEEAAVALRTSGTDGMSVANLMKRAGMTHGGFYAHFANRDDLVVHAVCRMFEDSTAMLGRHLSDGAGLASVAALVDHYLSETAMHRHERGCPLPWLAGEVLRMPAAAQARFRKGIADMRTAIARALVAGGHGDKAAEELAASVVAELVGAMALARASGEGDDAIAILSTARASIKRRIVRED